jgi:hypothetical protein
MMSGVVNVVETLAEYEFAMDERHDLLREVKVDVILRRCWIYCYELEFITLYIIGTMALMTFACLVIVSSALQNHMPLRSKSGMDLEGRGGF